MIFRWLFLFVFCFSALSIQAQSYSFLSYSIAEGLPQSQVSSIAEDEKGYLWVGTLGGLGKFNGSTFVNYSTKDGLLNNRITSLNCFDQKLWIGHEGGVSLLQNGKIKKWAFPEKNKNVNVLAINKFQNGYVIATNGGGIYFINEKFQIRNIELNSEDQNRVRGLSVFENELFIATRGGLLKTNDLYNFKSVKGADTLNISGITKNDTEFIITTFDTGIFKYDLKQKKIQVIGAIPSQTGIRNCIFDSKGNIWIPSKQGILIIDKNNKSRLIDQS